MCGGISTRTTECSCGKQEGAGHLHFDLYNREIRYSLGSESHCFAVEAFTTGFYGMASFCFFDPAGSQAMAVSFSQLSMTKTSIFQALADLVELSEESLLHTTASTIE